MSKRNKVILGYLLIILGISIPLYGFFKLSKDIIDGSSGYKSFMSSGMELDDHALDAIHDYNRSLSGDVAIVDPFANDSYASDYSFLEDKDQVFAYLSIPKIDVMEPVFLDASKKHLAMGVAHIEGTDLPSDKPGTRSVIAGHRGYYQAIMFWNLDKLANGDSVYLSWPNKTLEYKVVGSEIIKPWEWEKLDPISEKNMLTLLTCDPLTPPRKDRLLVNCTLVEDEKKVDVTEDKVEVASGVKGLKNGILAVTFVLILLLVVFVWKLFRFVSGKDSGEKGSGRRRDRRKAGRKSSKK